MNGHDTTEDDTETLMFELPDTLIDAATLATQLTDPDLRVFDCQVKLVPDPPQRYRIESGREDWRAGHVPGAGFLDLTGPPLSDPAAATAFTMPPPDRCAAGFAAMGIGVDNPVVLYSAGHVMWATRVWWMLTSLGHRNVAVLDGGLAAWQAAGLPLEQGEPEWPATEFGIEVDVEASAAMWADKTRVRRAIDGPETVVNALSPALHDGSAAMNYGRKGRISGSVNLYFNDLLDEDGRFVEVERTRALADGAGIDAHGEAILYCGGGIGATCDAFALRRAGFAHLRIYDGSLSEWAADPSLPMTSDH